MTNCWLKVGATMTSNSVKTFPTACHGQAAGAAGLNIFDRGKKSRGTKTVGPIVGTLFGKQFVAAGASEFVERSGSFRLQHHDHGVIGKFGHFDAE